jgi:hypothetical protein
MDNEQYAFLLGTLARVERKLDFLLEATQKDDTEDAFEEFDLTEDDPEETAPIASSSREPASSGNAPT